MTSLLTIALVVVAYGLFSRRISTTVVSGPMVFVALGWLLGPGGLDLIAFGLDEGVLRVLAEATLVLLLFTDAIRIDLKALRRHAQIPFRLLAVGLPLTVLAGTAAAYVLIPGLLLAEALVLGAVLAPTDAALGQAVVTDQRVPSKLRQALNVESGLNDGLIAPVVTVAVGLAVMGGEAETVGEVTSFIVRAVGFGVVFGSAVGWLGGKTLSWAAERKWVDGVFRQLVTLAIGVTAFAAAEALDGNGFVAAFVAGLAFGSAAREQCHGAYDFAEDEAQLLALLTFLGFGVGLSAIWAEIGWHEWVFAVLALTAVRMVPVWVALLGTHFKLPTVAFLGWFGPRGLASILFALFLIEEQLPIGPRLLAIVSLTALLSVVLHGVTAVPLAGRFGTWVHGRLADDEPEMEEVPEMPIRR